MQLFDPFFYEKAHLLIVLFLSLYYSSDLIYKSAGKLLQRERSQLLVFIYAIIFIIVVGLRPVSYAFGDTVVYARGFKDFSAMETIATFEKDSLFYSFMWVCSQFMNVNWFFFIIEILYIVPIIITCNRLFKNNADIGLLFCFAAFSFFTYGVNGIRNGVACSLVLIATTYIRGSVKDKVICALISIIALSIHASAALPIVCMIAAFFIKKPNLLFYFWGGAIIVSLVAGNSVANIFASLGFDDRISDYIHPDVEEDIYTSTGFRWDFLLYSAAPILLGWYVINKKRVFDSTYLLLLGTYIFANAFWIMVIRAEFSNRFAYLSWFLYPIILAYPLLKLRIWPKTQGRKTTTIMIAHLAFTLFMVFVVG